MQDALGHIGSLLVAGSRLIAAQGAVRVGETGGAVIPADRANTVIVSAARRVAKASIVDLVSSAGKGNTNTASIGRLGIDLGRDTAGAAIVDVSIRALGTALGESQATYIIPGAR